MLLCDWAPTQWPYIIYPDLTIEAAASPHSTLTFLLATTLIGTLLLIPAMAFLFNVFQGHNSEGTEAGS